MDGNAVKTVEDEKKYFHCLDPYWEKYRIKSFFQGYYSEKRG